MSARADSAPRDAGPLPDARLLGRGLAALRIFVGVIFFANGLAKLFAFATSRSARTARS
jgi:uncharacterized membrane protein YphA (DoxX/SURF4 family)